MKGKINAEDSASAYLRQKGFLILARNRRIENIEIDIIAKKKIKNIYHTYFIEVKCVRLENYNKGFTVFPRNQFLRYRKCIHLWYSQAKRSFPCHISLIVFNEHLKCIDFFPDFF